MCISNLPEGHTAVSLSNFRLCPPPPPPPAKGQQQEQKNPDHMV